MTRLLTKNTAPHTIGGSMNIFLQAKEKLGLSYADLAKAIGFDRNYIHNMLNGTRSFNKSNLVKIARYLDIKEEDAIEAWKEMELERLKKSLEVKCGKLEKCLMENIGSNSINTSNNTNIFLEAKEKLGISYADLAKAIGYNRSHLYSMLHGNLSMPLNNLVKLTRYLGIKEESAIEAWREMERERLEKALEADCMKLLELFEKDNSFQET
jgi:cyanate lyase